MTVESHSFLKAINPCLSCRFYDAGLESSMTKLLAIPLSPLVTHQMLRFCGLIFPASSACVHPTYSSNPFPRRPREPRGPRGSREPQRDLVTLNSHLGGSITPCEHGPYSPQEMCWLPAGERWGSRFLDERQADTAAMSVPAAPLDRLSLDTSALTILGPI